MSSEQQFNLDLTLIERQLTQCGMHVESALVMPRLLSEPLQQDSVFVMLLDDSARSPDEISGYDMQQYVTERFAVVLGLRSPGDSTGVNATESLLSKIQCVKAGLTGLIFGSFEPIQYEAGRIIDVNKDTQTVLYQLQFKTAHTVVSQVKQQANHWS